MGSAALQHDLVAVGAGIGGLTAAALAARAGRNVVVLEAHTRPGGCAGDFIRMGSALPAGATLLTGFEPGGLHHQIYTQLGLEVRAQPLDEAMRVVLPDRECAIPTDAESWKAARRQAFPERRDASERFWRRVHQVAREAYALATRRPVLPPASWRELWRTTRCARPTTLGVAREMLRTVGDLALASGLDQHGAQRRFLDGQLLITMQCESDSCVSLNGALALELYRFGAFYLEGGSAAVARDLALACQRHGGSVRYRERVQTLAPRHDGWDILLASGARMQARSVVANLTAWSLARVLGPLCPPKLAHEARRRSGEWGAVVVHALIEPPAAVESRPRFYQTLGAYDRPLEEGNSCFVSAYPPEAGRSLARLTVSTHTRVEPWWALSDRAAYLERKAEYADKLLAAAERVMPGLRPRLRLTETATPRTFARFTGREQGLVGGTPQTLAFANFRARSVRTGLPGLFTCGDTVFPGQGTLGVTLSGINAWQAASEHVARAC